MSLAPAQEVSPATMVTGPSSVVDVCARRLAPLNDAGPGVEGRVSWYGSAGFPSDRPGSEATLQAVCGLMAVHGREAGRPRRIGLDVVSTAAGVLAAHGLVAAMVARRRGLEVAAVETSALQAGLLLTTHYTTLATCAEGWSPPDAGTGPGPPFPTSDGQWFVLETLDPEAWKRFWMALGVAGSDLGRAWTVFRLRYHRAACSLPPQLHEVTARHTLAEAAQVAEASGMSLCRLRHYPEVLSAPGPGDGLPVVVPLPARAAGPSPAGNQGLPPPGPLPLSGIRVVEATNRIQGPLAGLLLQMLGAEVLLVEPPGGDIGRMSLPEAGGVGAFFLCFNRGKATVEIDLSRASGRAELVELVVGADVFVHNWRPGKAAQWDLTAETLATVNPRLVYAQASAWGDREQEMGHVIGTEYPVQAYVGMGDGLNPLGEPPLPCRVLVTDYLAGMIACEGILRALYLREQAGGAWRSDTSLLGAAMALQAPVLQALAAGREKGRRMGRPVWGPLDHPLPAGDGWLVVSVEGGEALGRSCRALGLAAPANGPPASERALAERIAGQPAAECEDRLVSAGVPCATVSTDLAALPADPRMSGLFEPLDDAAWVPCSPWVFTP